MMAAKKMGWMMGLVICLSSVMVGCHTVKGAGQDVSAGGHALSRAAETSAGSASSGSGS